MNVTKTVYIPLYPTTELQATKDIAHTNWRSMIVSIGYGKYLGYFVGPYANADVNFEAPMRKFRERVAYWLSMRHLGSYFQVLGFNMCALSVLSFISQLYMLPAAMVADTRSMALQFMLGPSEWFMGRGVHRGHAYFRAQFDLNMKASPRCPEAYTMCHMFNTINRFMFDFMTKYYTLSRLVGILPFQLGTKVLHDSPAASCKLVHTFMQQPGVMREFRETVPLVGPATAAYRAIFKVIHSAGSVECLFDSRYRERWIKKKIISSSKVVGSSTAAIANLKWLSQHVPPRVHLSNIRLHLNGWHTAARYQQKLRCVFCSNPRAEDRLEHILVCPVIQQAMPAQLRSASDGRVTADTLFLFGLSKPDRLLAALYVHAIYTLHNTYRHTPDRGELRQAVERIILDIPLNSKLRKFVVDSFLFAFA